MEKPIAVAAPFHGLGERILIGIADFFRKEKRYRMRPFELDGTSDYVDSLNRDYAGCICVDPNGEKVGQYSAFEIPLVTVFQEAQYPSVGSVVLNDEEIGAMAADHYHGRGFQDYAFAGSITQPRIKRVYQSFKNCLDLKRSNLHLFSERFPSTGFRSSGTGSQLSIFQKRLQNWIASLPKPVGIFVVDDWQSYEIQLACHELQISIPDSVALLGVNDDALACNISSPSLTSIRLPYEKMGAEAGRALMEVMQGETPKKRIVKPIGVVVRESTRTIAVKDEVVRRGMDFIEKEGKKPIHVEDILKHLGVSRSLLERRFRSELGRTPLVELRRQRVERARQLLADSELPINKIAEMSGFASNIRFTTVFREQVGITPSEFRKAMFPTQVK